MMSLFSFGPPDLTSPTGVALTDSSPLPASLPALMVGGVRSGCGKTTLTLALLAALRARNIRVLGCKAGPDFIDSAHHSALTGQPSYNLDAWMGGEGGLERAFAAAVQHLHGLPLPPMAGAPLTGTQPKATPLQPPQPNALPHIQKMLVVEGVMGLFDGASSPQLGGEGLGSSAQVARRCALPILLVVDVRGMAQSVAPMVQGFLHYRDDIRFAGIVCTHVGGPRHQTMLKEALAHVDAPLIGLLPRAGAPVLPSRHLGLCMPHEVNTHAVSLATWVEEHADIDALLSIVATLHNPCAASVTQERSAACFSQPNILATTVNTASTVLADPAPSPPCATAVPKLAEPSYLAPSHPSAAHPAGIAGPAGIVSPLPPPSPARTSPLIAIARDHAFCFLYPDFAPVLQSLGARTLFFSPLQDLALPHCDALYLPGGYPELFAPQLSANVAMRTSIYDHARHGGTVYGECGGYMYMMRTLTTATGTWPMSACLPLECRMEEQRVALGYRNAIAASPASRDFWGTGSPVRGHEYHYARLLPSQQPVAPLWQVSDAAGKPLPAEGSCMGRIAGSWLHLYPQGARELLQHFVQGL